MSTRRQSPRYATGRSIGIQYLESTVVRVATPSLENKKEDDKKEEIKKEDDKKEDDQEEENKKEDDEE